MKIAKILTGMLLLSSIFAIAGCSKDDAPMSDPSTWKKPEPMPSAPPAGAEQGQR